METIEEVYCPTYIDNFKVYFVVINPDEYEIEFTKLTWNDKQLPEYMETYILDGHKREWEAAIIMDMKYGEVV